MDLWRTAVSATLHCLTGCAIGEVLGMVIGTALGWHDAATVALSVALAFVFGYALTMRSALGAGLALGAALQLALAADTVSILVMEVVDNALILLIPGRHGRRPGQPALLGQPRPGAGRGLRGHGAGQPLADRPRPRSRRGARDARPPLTLA